MNEEQAIFDLLFAILLFSLLSQTLNADPQRGGQTLKRNPQQLWQTLNMFDLPLFLNYAYVFRNNIAQDLISAFFFFIPRIAPMTIRTRQTRTKDAAKSLRISFKGIN